MTNIINSLENKYKVSNSGINQENLQGSIEKSKQVVSTNINENSAMQALGGSTDPKTRNATIALVPVLAVADSFVNKAMAGTKGKGLLARIANLGDKISNTLNLDKLISTETKNKFTSFFKNNRFTKYFSTDFKANPIASMAKGSTMSDKYSGELLGALTSAKFDYNSSGVLAGSKISEGTKKVLSQIGTLKQPITPEFLTSVEKSIQELATKVTDPSDIQMLATLKGNIDGFRAGYQPQPGGLFGGFKTLFKSIKNIGLSLVGKTPEKHLSSQHIADDIATVFGTVGQKYGSELMGSSSSVSRTTRDIISSISTDKVKPTIEQMIDAADDLAKNGVDVIKSGDKSVSITQAGNKLKAATMKTGKTGLGKLFAKGTLKGKDILTYGGGLISLYFMASAIVNAVKATKEAPKGEKKSTFMHVLSEQYLGIILFQPSINVLYKLGGNKYRGMTKEGRQALTNLISSTNTNRNLTNEALKVAKIQKKLLLKGVDHKKVADLAGKTAKEAKHLAKTLGKEGAKLKFWEHPLKFIGKILSTGLDTLKKPKYIGNFKIPKPTLKGFIGGLGRFAIIMFVFQPLLQKPITKLCHKIFGKPKTYLKKQEEQNAQQTNQPNTSQLVNLNTTINTTPNQNSTNLLEFWNKQQNATNQTQIAQQPIYNQQQPIYNQQQPVYNQQQLVYNQQQPVYNQQQPVYNQQQPINNQSPTLKQQEEIPAFNLFKKEEKQKERYIPSINFEPIKTNDEEIEKLAEELLKKTNPALTRAQKALAH